MPGNRELYDSEMNAGHEAAWIQDWVTAANHYGRALQEFKDDVEAHLNLGFALLRADRLNEALQVYTRASSLSPADPIPQEKSADVLEKMGRIKDASHRYATVADLYLKQRDIDKAISNWEKATELTPGLAPIHNKLAKAYHRIGDRKRALYQYLMLAYTFSLSGDSELAKKAAQKALALNKRSTEALNAMSSIEAGAVVRMPTLPTDTEEKATAQSLDDLDWDLIANTSTGAAGGDASQQFELDDDPLGPMGTAMTDSLAMLATHIMQAGGFEKGGVEALQAMELQRQALHSEAIKAYQQANKSMSHPALSMNLGALFLLSEQFENAVPHLNNASQDEQIKPGAYHAMGQVYLRQERYKQSVGYLLQTAQMIDLMQGESEEDRTAINSIYNSASEALKARSTNDQNLPTIANRLLSFMREREWPKRLRDARHQMAEAQREGGGQRVLDWLSEDISADVTQSVARIDRYIRQKAYTLAMDEAQYAIEKAPSYLPVHVRMAEVMMVEGRVRQAINKYNAVAKTYRVRGENGRAASILFEVLEMAPLDIAVRRNLIELLEGEERIDESLDQYIELASTYRQMGNFDMARETYIEAERLAQQTDVDKAKVVKIKHAIADIDQLRLDMRRAQQVYEEIIKLDGGDERAHRSLVEINLQLGNQIQGIKQLDELLRLYAKRKQVKHILKLLQDLVRSYPDDTGLRSRLAAIYRQLGRVDEAVEQLDKLANLQLDSGLTDDACDTVRQIIKLNPPNVDQFKEALIKLGCTN